MSGMERSPPPPLPQHPLFSDADESPTRGPHSNHRALPTTGSDSHGGEGFYADFVMRLLDSNSSQDEDLHLLHPDSETHTDLAISETTTTATATATKALPAPPRTSSRGADNTGASDAPPLLPTEGSDYGHYCCRSYVPPPTPEQVFFYGGCYRKLDHNTHTVHTLPPPRPCGRGGDGNGREDGTLGVTDAELAALLRGLDFPVWWNREALGPSATGPDREGGDARSDNVDEQAQRALATKLFVQSLDCL